MFGVGNYAKIKGVEYFEKYSLVKIVISQKDKKTNKWNTSFVGKVTFVGNAHLQRPIENQKIKITSCGVSNSYTKDDKLEFLKNPRYVIFEYELQEDSGNAKNQPNLIAMDDGDDYIPF